MFGETVAFWGETTFLSTCVCPQALFFAFSPCCFLTCRHPIEYRVFFQIVPAWDCVLVDRRKPAFAFLLLLWFRGNLPWRWWGFVFVHLICLMR